MAKNLGELTAEMDNEQFCKNNGIVIRTILARWRVSTFTWRELLQVLAAYHMDEEDVLEAMLCFDEMGYIKTKTGDTAEAANLIDYTDDLDEVYFSLGKKGREIARGLEKDPSIML